jgi:hypothetical protein
LTIDRLSFDDAAVAEVIDSYTREAGVRNLEREIANVIRAVAVLVAEGKSQPSERVTHERIAEFLGPAKYISEVAERTAEPGVATGLAWTPVGGDILFIEATKMNGKGQLVLTGQLGDVMKESAQAALSFIRARAKWLGLEENFLEKTDIHVHIPAGAIPKDGPSAGVTMFVAMASLLTNKPIRNDVAMTGEITLRGAGAAGRRHQGEVPGRAPRGHQARRAPGAQPQGRHRDPGAAAQRDRDSVRQAHGRAAAAGADGDAEAGRDVRARAAAAARAPAARGRVAPVSSLRGWFRRRATVAGRSRESRR